MTQPKVVVAGHEQCHHDRPEGQDVQQARGDEMPEHSGTAHQAEHGVEEIRTL